jgi:leucyl/phenylalanyl-tRNA--protein transferase
VPVYRLPREFIFPSPELAEPDGLLAIGGDLSIQRLIRAYCLGIFPWYDTNSPILWWSPDPRFVLFPEELHVSRSLRQTIKKEPYRITFDLDFLQVIESCATLHGDTKGATWITSEMIEAYMRLHRAGYAHSVESWSEDGTLAGGLYGVCIGTIFFGESMFARQKDASKVAFVTLVETLRQQGCSLIDCQIQTDHLNRFGARHIPRKQFLAILHQGIQKTTCKGPWHSLKTEAATT